LETPDTAEVKVVAWSHMPQLSLISLKWFWSPHEMNQGGGREGRTKWGKRGGVGSGREEREG